MVYSRLSNCNDIEPPTGSAFLGWAVKLRLTTFVQSHGNCAFCIATGTAESPAIVLIVVGSKLYVNWAVVESWNLATMVTTLASGAAPAMPTGFLKVVQTKMDLGLIVRPPVVEMTMGVFAGEVMAAASLGGERCQ